MHECRCGHPREDHVTGLCLSTLDCLCRGYAPCDAEDAEGREEGDHLQKGHKYPDLSEAEEYL